MIAYQFTFSGPFFFAAEARGAGTAFTVSLGAVGSTYLKVDRRLACAAGAYALAGVASVRKLSRTAVVGSYVLTGRASLHIVTMPAVVGSYVLTGGVALKKQTRVAATGAYALTGGTATLVRAAASTLVASTGSYALTGIAATFGIKMPAVAGSYALTGVASIYAVTMPAAAGSYVLTGGTALKKQSRTATTGSYALTGVAATLTRSTVVRTLSAVPGSYALGGVASTFGIRMPAAAGSYALTGVAAIPRVTMPAVAGAYALTGGVALKKQIRTAATISYALTGKTANLVKASARTLVASTGSYALTGVAAIRGIRMSAATGAYGLMGFGAIFNVTLPAGFGAYVVTGNAVTFSKRTVYSLVCSAGSYALAAPDTSLSKQAAGSISGSMSAYEAIYIKADTTAYRADNNITKNDFAFPNDTAVFAGLVQLMPLPAVAGSYALTGQAVIPVRTLVRSAAAGSYALTGQTSVSKFNHLFVAKGSYVVSGTSATLTKTGAYSLVCSKGTYALTGQVAGRKLSWTTSVGSYALTGSATTRRLGLPAAIGSYALTGQVALRKLRQTAAVGSYAVTGAATTFGIKIIASSGAYVLGGVAAKFGIKLPAGYGAYVVTGSNAAINKVGAYQLVCSKGTYALSGIAAALVRPGLSALVGTLAAYEGLTYLRADSTAYTADNNVTKNNFASVSGDTSVFAGSLLTSYALTLVKGTYVVSGVPVGLSKTGSYSLASNAGTYVLTGGAANRKLLRKAVVGSYALNGVAATFGIKLPAGYGAYVVTGSVAGLNRKGVYSLVCSAGTFALSGVVSTLTRSGLPTITGTLAAVEALTYIKADTTAYTADNDVVRNNIALTSGDAAAFAGLTTTLSALVAAAGSYTLTGQAAVRKLSMPAVGSAYTLTGGTSASKFNHLIASGRAFTLSGSAVLMIDSGAPRLLADTGSYALTGQAALRKLRWVTSAGAYALTGLATIRKLELPTVTGVYALTGPSILRELRWTLSTGAYAQSGVPAEFRKGGPLSLVCSGGTYALTGGVAILVKVAAGALSGRLEAFEGANYLTADRTDYLADSTLIRVNTALYFTDVGAFNGFFTIPTAGVIAAIEAPDVPNFQSGVSVSGTLHAVESTDTTLFLGFPGAILNAFEGGTGVAVTADSTLVTADSTAITADQSFGGDQAVFSGGVVTSGMLAATEAAADSAGFTASVPTTGVLAGAEAGDTAAFSTAVFSPATLDATELGVDKAAFHGFVGAVTGVLAAREDSDTAFFHESEWEDVGEGAGLEDEVERTFWLKNISGRVVYSKNEQMRITELRG